MICFGVTNAVAALATGSIVKLTGRKPVMFFAFCLHLSLFIFMLRWKPMPEQGITFFLVSGLWGVCDSIWLVQVNGEREIIKFLVILQNSFIHLIVMYHILLIILKLLCDVDS